MTLHFEHNGVAADISVTAPALGRIESGAERLFVLSPTQQADWVEELFAEWPDRVLNVPWTFERGNYRAMSAYGNGAHTRWRHIGLAYDARGSLVDYVWRCSLDLHPQLLVQARVYRRGAISLDYAWCCRTNRLTPLKTTLSVPGWMEIARLGERLLRGYEQARDYR